MSYLIKTVLAELDKVCYISLNKSGESVYEFCKENNINTDKMFVIDMISSRFRKCKSVKSIEYLPVSSLEKQMKAVIKVLKKKKCDSVIFDSLSALKVYYSEEELIKFAHEFLVYTEAQHIITNLVIQKEDIEKEWANALIPLMGSVKDL
jgi:KaiC/GvpD/RAD55 family RecA-like ATPase